MSATPSFAYLAERRLYLSTGGNQPREVESQFVAQIHDRRAAARERNQHRREGMAWGISEYEQGDAFADIDVANPEFTGITPAADGQLYFAIANEGIGGLFLLDTASDEERRLLHKQQLHLTDLDRNTNDGSLICSSRASDGAAHIALLTKEGGAYQVLTEGDVVDQAPRWVPGTEQTFVYQTSGIGRDEHGGYVGLSPSAVQRLDLDSGRLEVLLELPEHDCLAPRMDADGNLYYIRRPYEFQPRISNWRVLQDMALFPYRLVRAGVQFLDLFSQMFSDKPLITAGGPTRRGPEQRNIWLRGRWIEVRHNTRNPRHADRPLVPDDWVLVRRNPNGSETELAKNVVAFDVSNDGNALYTDGASVFHQKKAAAAEKISSGHLIEAVRLLS